MQHVPYAGTSRLPPKQPATMQLMQAYRLLSGSAAAADRIHTCTSATQSRSAHQAHLRRWHDICMQANTCPQSPAPTGAATAHANCLGLPANRHPAIAAVQARCTLQTRATCPAERLRGTAHCMSDHLPWRCMACYFSPHAKTTYVHTCACYRYARRICTQQAWQPTQMQWLC